jgi:hydrogenase maturation protease
MKVAVVGAGTILFQDEGVGVYAVKYLEENFNFEGDITLVDGGVLGFKLMTYYTDYDRVIILDTITMHQDDPGSIYNIPAQELLGLGSYKQTAHEVEIVEMLEIAALNGNISDVQIIGIVPFDILSVNIGLSDPIKKAFPLFIKTALEEIKKTGIKIKSKKRQKTLKEVIHHYNNPDAKNLITEQKGKKWQ